MRNLLRGASGLEAALGLALIVDPGVVSRLLLGEGLSSAGIALGHVAGFALVALGWACWPPRAADVLVERQLQALLTYNIPLTIFLVYHGIAGTLVGILLWPAVALHAAFSFLLVRAWMQRPKRR
jgi:hypothetical protein